MPFDATSEAVRTTSVLEMIGLVPVPQEVLDAHKENYKRAYFAGPRPHLSARWLENSITAFTNAGIDMFTWLRMGVNYEPDMAAPDAVKAIVADTERRLTEQNIPHERILGTFYTDPYIRIVYTEDGKDKSACLAIWDQGKVLHIAKLYD